MEKDDLIKLVETMINSFQSNSKQFNFNFHIGNNFQNVTAQASLGPGSMMTGGKITGIEASTTIDENTNKFMHNYEQSADRQLRNQYISVLEEFKKELERQKPDKNVLQKILDKSLNIFPDVIFKIFSQFITHLMGI